MGTCFESGKDKAAKGEGWVPPFINCAQDTVEPLTPTAHTAIRLGKPLPFISFTIFFEREEKERRKREEERRVSFNAAVKLVLMGLVSKTRYCSFSSHL